MSDYPAIVQGYYFLYGTMFIISDHADGLALMKENPDMPFATMAKLHATDDAIKAMIEKLETTNRTDARIINGTQ